MEEETGCLQDLAKVNSQTGNHRYNLMLKIKEPTVRRLDKCWVMNLYEPFKDVFLTQNILPERSTES